MTALRILCAVGAACAVLNTFLLFTLYDEIREIHGWMGDISNAGYERHGREMAELHRIRADIEGKGDEAE